MLRCCNRQLLTPFCSMCGKPRDPEDPVQELLGYLRNQLRIREKQLHNWVHIAGYRAEGDQQTISYREVVTRWKSRVESLEKLVANAGKTPDDEEKGA